MGLLVCRIRRNHLEKRENHLLRQQRRCLIFRCLQFSTPPASSYLGDTEFHWRGFQILSSTLLWSWWTYHRLGSCLTHIYLLCPPRCLHCYGAACLYVIAFRLYALRRLPAAWLPSCNLCACTLCWRIHATSPTACYATPGLVCCRPASTPLAFLFVVVIIIVVALHVLLPPCHHPSPVTEGLLSFSFYNWISSS